MKSRSYVLNFGCWQGAKIQIRQVNVQQVDPDCLINSSRIGWMNMVPISYRDTTNVAGWKIRDEDIWHISYLKMEDFASNLSLPETCFPFNFSTFCKITPNSLSARLLPYVSRFAPVKGCISKSTDVTDSARRPVSKSVEMRLGSVTNGGEVLPRYVANWLTG